MDVFSNTQVAWECLLDKRRTKFLRDSIVNNVKNGDIVLDSGAGTGILSMFAAKKASKVYSIEIAPDLALDIRRNLFLNKIKNCEVINQDVTQVDKLAYYDVVIMEMLDTGLIAEQQAQAINHLITNHSINVKTIIIPSELISYIQLVDYNFNFFGFEFCTTVQARNYGAMKNIRTLLSEKIIYDHVVFNQKIKTSVKKKVNIIIKKDGLANAVLISSRVITPCGSKHMGTSDMVMPVIVPIDPRKTRRNQQMELYIEYNRGKGFGGLKILYG